VAKIQVKEFETGKSIWSLFEGMEKFPQELQDEMLQAELAVVQREQLAAAQKLNIKGFGTGGTANALTAQGPFGRDGQRYMKLFFKGTRPNGKGKTRSNGTIAFFNEFGSKKIHARAFISGANKKCADEAVQAAAKKLDEWMSKN